MLTLGGVLNNLAERYSALPALIDDNETLSYGELVRRANCYASWARREGLAPGSTIALLMRNCADYVAIWVGLSQVGCVVALINTNLTQAALAHAIRVAGARALIVETALQDCISAIMPTLPELCYWRHGDGDGVWPRVELAAAAELGLRPPPIEAGNAPALLIYTSGTTGLPKAARVSHDRILRWSYWFAGLMNTQPDDVLYNCLPMYHSTGGVSSIGAMLVRGGAVYIRRQFSVRRFWPEIIGSKATIFQYIGELCRYLLNVAPSLIETQHQLRLCCGNGMREEVWRSFEKRFKIPQIIEFYAMTEGAVSLYNCEGRPGAIGHVPGFLAHRFPISIVQYDQITRALVRGKDGRCISCSPNEVGEALGRISTENTSDSISRFDGYTDSELTATKVARGVYEDNDVWYRTGDLMRRDKDGYYYFVDRLGDAFRWKGENVSASEVASVIMLLSGIIDAVVYGVKIPENEGRAGMAALSVDASFDLSVLWRHVHENLPSYARPVFIRRCSSIERTGTFKLSGGILAAEGYEAAPIEELWFDDRKTGAYISCNKKLLDDICRGAVLI